MSRLGPCGEVYLFISSVSPSTNQTANYHAACFLSFPPRCRILTAMTSGGPIGYIEDDIKFTLAVLKDGASLEWGKGQYEKRKRAVRGILVGCSSEVWKNDEFAFGLVSDLPDDPLFRKKGWNKMDSGFRLWGGGGDDDEFQQQAERRSGGNSASVDAFLASKGWNDIDSGFRLI